MSFRNLFQKRSPALLTVQVNGKEVCTVDADELPSEKTPSIQVGANSIVFFIDSTGTTHSHSLGLAQGWAHFSVRVHINRACQSDCVVSESPTFDATAITHGNATGIRFQPFFLRGASVSNAELAGKGLFRRGLHFSGNITPGNILLSCECDKCHRSFLIRSYHVGFSNSGYFYSASGKFTLTVSVMLAGSPAPLSTPDPNALAVLEQSLPLAPDGSSYGYLNPFRCRYCGEPYINFEANPGLRESEYYGNYFADSELVRYEPDTIAKS
jgi:hypothetical protein